MVAGVLAILGLRALVGRVAVPAMARRITRPTLTMLTATIISPLGIAGWLGLDQGSGAVMLGVAGALVI
ncbi:MAG: hypothetical protein GY713_01895 [Actinomycetia bacterium]|nr:hypothetical protein [Actinomycetes bacterium]